MLRKDIIDKSLSLDWIWKRIRKHYNLQQSEVHFLRIANIKKEVDERYETLFQRIIAHLDDNLLTTDSGIEHDGARIAANEELTPTCERLAVYLWLNLIDQRLPGYVARTYSHDLQKQSLKDLQPRICDAMDSLLAELQSQEDIQVNFSRSSYNSNNNNYRGNKGSRSNNRNSFQRQLRTRAQQRPQGSSTMPKDCILCKTAGRPSQGHNISSCWYVSKADRLDMVKAFQISVEFDDDEGGYEGDEIDNALLCTTEASEASDTVVTAVKASTVCRVRTTTSPYFFAFYFHHTCKILVDTGATSTLVSLSFVKRVNIPIRPTKHSARQLDKSSVPVSGEVRFYISFGKRQLLVEGLVNLIFDDLLEIIYYKKFRFGAPSSIIGCRNSI